MPIYEYRCEKCGDFEVTQRITEDPLKKCPTCKRKIHKLMSNTSFQLKGSGWYVTDYARAGKDKDGKDKDKDKDKGAAKESSGGDTASESSASASTSETKSESKSETKSDGKKKKPSAKAA